MTAQFITPSRRESELPTFRAKNSTLTWDAVAIPALLVIWLLCHPYFGNNRGSLIYSARALADLDPGGVGRDAMFRLDGQSGFTIFTPIFRALTEAFGVAQATMGVALAATLLFFAAAVTLAWRMAEGRTRYAIVVFIAALPSYYGGYQIFRFAEASATPRPFAEAFVLFGVAALLANRRVLALLCMGVAASLHPIMALPGVALAAIWLMLEDRRWLWAGLAGGAVIVGAVVAGVPPLDRIATVIDKEWLSILIERNPHLFPGLWRDGWAGRQATEIAILLTAASVAGPRLRNLFLITLAVGVAGFLAAYLLGEKMELLLVIQAQTWRMMWLIFAIGSAAAAVAAVQLWKGDYAARLTLMFLALAVVFQAFDWAGVAFAATALVLRFGLSREMASFSPRGFWFTFSLGSALALAGLIFVQWAMRAYLAPVPADIIDDMRRTLTVSYDFTLFAVIAGAWAAGDWRISNRAAIAAAAFVGAFFAYTSWDRRSDEGRFTDMTGQLADLQRLMASRPGEVYWINGVRENWSWLGRPHWISAIQGASIVFSRDLAMQYRDRARRVIAAGLADDEIVTPLTEPHLHELPPPDPEKLTAFCRAPDAPAWIVRPLENGQHTRHGEIEWTAPAEKIEILDKNGSLDWRRVSRYALIPCGI